MDVDAVRSIDGQRFGIAELHSCPLPSALPMLLEVPVDRSTHSSTRDIANVDDAAVARRPAREPARRCLTPARRTRMDESWRRYHSTAWLGHGTRAWLVRDIDGRSRDAATAHRLHSIGPNALARSAGRARTVGSQDLFMDTPVVSAVSHVACSCSMWVSDAITTRRRRCGPYSRNSALRSGSGLRHDRATPGPRDAEHPRRQVSTSAVR